LSQSGGGRSSALQNRGAALVAALTGIAASSYVAPTMAEPSPIPIVTMSDAGPDKELPTGGAFYLAGKVDKQVAAVYPVFVRASYPPLGIGGARSCSLTQKSLSAGQLIRAKDTPVIETLTGVLPIERLWATPSSAAGADVIGEYERLNAWHNAYVPPAWVRPAGQAEGASYQVLVSEPRYFRPGATYCLFVYEQRKISEQEKQRIPKLLWEHRKKRAACDASGGGGAARSCAAVDKEFVDKLNELLSEAGRERAKEVLFKVRTELVNAAASMSSFLPDMKAALDPKKWSPPFKVGEAAWGPPRDFIDVDADPLGRLIVELLASKGHIHRAVYPTRASGEVVDGKRIDCVKDRDACTGRVSYATRSGSIAIRYVRARPGLDAFEVASDKSPSPAERDEVAVPAGSLTIYGAGITLEDAMELARGKIKIGSRYTPFEGVYSTVVVPAVDKQETSLEETGLLAEPPALVDLGARVSALRGAVSLACAGARAAQPQKGEGRGAAGMKAAVLATDRMAFEPAARALMGLWLEEAALTSCGPYAGAEMDPLEAIAGHLEGYLAAVKTWREGEGAMTVELTKISTELPRRTPLVVQSRLTQETFFDTYVTPYLGRSALIKPGEDIGMTYAGIQVYLWPNDVAEPMWMNGAADMRRLVGLEIGVGLETGDFGEGARFSGPGPLPPIFVGAAVHGLPYLTLSLGASILDRRRSALIPETRDMYASFYMGLTAQLNAIGIVRNLTSGRGSSKAEEK
jgi:hypothetical protein